MDPLLILLYIAAGAVAGTLAGLVGIGGGILYVPVLVYTLGHQLNSSDTPQVAVSTSLAVITVSLFASAYTHYKAGNINRLPLPGLILGGTAGSVLASLALGMVDAGQFKLLLAAFELLIAFQLFRGAKAQTELNRPPTLRVFLGIGLVGGLMSSFFGVGGGVIVMPMMHFFAGYRINKAVGATSIYMIFVGLTGLISHGLEFEITSELEGLWHQIYLPGFLGLMPTAFVFNRVGALWVNRIRPELVKQGVGGLLLALAALNGYAGLRVFF